MMDDAEIYRQAELINLMNVNKEYDYFLHDQSTQTIAMHAAARVCRAHHALVYSDDNRLTALKEQLETVYDALTALSTATTEDPKC